ncbi:hypothetical protein TNCV_3683891 [Trichonephila clavipes]|nr:hypothetical protein TNCV_3683891 [Trichonephila clavipes]
MCSNCRARSSTFPGRCSRLESYPRHAQLERDLAICLAREVFNKLRREEIPGWRELEESAKEKRLGRWKTEIGVERKERRRTPVALDNWNECLKR